MCEAMCDESVSVIIPAYNVAVSLGRCIDSALSQTVRPAQIIVINDGSTDHTAQVAKPYGDNIIYIEQENQGQGAARNVGLRVAERKYVAFLDADDYWLPDFLRNCVEFLETHHEAIAVSTGQIIKLWGHEDLVRPPILTKSDRQKPKEAFVLEDFFGFWAEQNHITTGSNLIRRDAIEKAGYQLADLRKSQDLEYWGYLATFGKWGFIPRVLFVGDPTPVAASQGWLSKYNIRSKLCPSVEQWQRRIIPRLRGKDWAGFRIVRGRVAASFAHSKILAGNDLPARKIVQEYGELFPLGMITYIMRIGNKLGRVGWKIACESLRLREYTKASLMELTNRNLKYYHPKR